MDVFFKDKFRASFSFHDIKDCELIEKANKYSNNLTPHFDYIKF